VTKKKYGVIIDLDGTLMHKGEATKGAKAFIEFLTDSDILFRVLTNGVGKSPKELSGKLSRLGITIEENKFINPITVLNRFIEANKVKSYFFVGQKKIESLLAIESNFEDTPEYVILSDLEDSDYECLNKIFGYLKQGAKLITMSQSEYYITKEGPRLDTGAFSRMLEIHANENAILFGKPDRKMLDEASTQMKLLAENVIVIDDEKIVKPNLIVENLEEMMRILDGNDIIKTLNK